MLRRRKAGQMSIAATTVLALDGKGIEDGITEDPTSDNIGRRLKLKGVKERGEIN